MLNERRICSVNLTEQPNKFINLEERLPLICVLFNVWADSEISKYKFLENGWGIDYLSENSSIVFFENKSKIQAETEAEKFRRAQTFENIKVHGEYSYTAQLVQITFENETKECYVIRRDLI